MCIFGFLCVNVVAMVIVFLCVMLLPFVPLKIISMPWIA